MSEVTDKAIELLRTKGWTRGSLHNQFGYCLSGAISAATSRLYHKYSGDRDRVLLGETQHTAMQVVQQILAERGCDCSIPKWNDREAKDIDEVIEVLKLAGERLEAMREQR